MPKELPELRLGSSGPCGAARVQDGEAEAEAEEATTLTPTQQQITPPFAPPPLLFAQARAALLESRLAEAEGEAQEAP